MLHRDFMLRNRRSRMMHTFACLHTNIVTFARILKTFCVKKSAIIVRNLAKIHNYEPKSKMILQVLQNPVACSSLESDPELKPDPNENARSGSVL